MILFWISAVLFIFGMFLIYHDNVKDATISTVVVIIIVLVAATMLDKTMEKTPNTLLSCQVEKRK